MPTDEFNHLNIAGYHQFLELIPRKPIDHIKANLDDCLEIKSLRSEQPGAVFIAHITNGTSAAVHLLRSKLEFQSSVSAATWPPRSSASQSSWNWPKQIDINELQPPDIGHRGTGTIGDNGAAIYQPPGDYPAGQIYNTLLMAQLVSSVGLCRGRSALCWTIWTWFVTKGTYPIW